jgi:hypothetical protein
MQYRLVINQLRLVPPQRKAAFPAAYPAINPQYIPTNHYKSETVCRAVYAVANLD